MAAWLDDVSDLSHGREMDRLSGSVSVNVPVCMVIIARTGSYPGNRDDRLG